MCKGKNAARSSMKNAHLTPKAASIQVSSLILTLETLSVDLFSAHLHLWNPWCWKESHHQLVSLYPEASESLAGTTYHDQAAHIMNQMVQRIWRIKEGVNALLAFVVKGKKLWHPSFACEGQQHFVESSICSSHNDLIRISRDVIWDSTLMF